MSTIVEHELPTGGISDLDLDQKAADAMIAKGFRFAFYDKKLGRFELAPIYEVSRDFHRPVWVIRQILPDDRQWARRPPYSIVNPGSEAPD